MFSSSWRKRAFAEQARAAKGLGLFGLVTSTLGDFYRLIRYGSTSGKQKKEDEESSSLLSTSSTSPSEEAIKKRFVIKRRSLGPRDPDAQLPTKKTDRNLLILIMRFLSGVILTQGFYFLLTYQSQWNPKKAALYTGLIGFVVSAGMAFNKGIRSVVALVLPTFCTGKGRSIIVAFCLMLVLTGPAANISYNFRQMRKSLTCSDELGYNVTQGFQTIVQNGQNAILSTMDDTVDTVIEAVERAKEAYEGFAGKLQSVSDVISRYNNFLMNMGNVCKKELGAFLCIVPSFVAKQARIMLAAPVYNAMARIQKEFAFNISYSHELKFNVKKSKKFTEVTKGIIDEVKKKVTFAHNLFDWVKIAMAFSTLFIIIKAVKYRYKYLTKNDFDNCYITKEFIKLDRRRKKQKRLAVLPLKAKEISVYVRPTRIWMSRMELKKFAKGLSFLSFNFGYTIIVLIVDYVYYRLLTKITLSLTLRRQRAALVNKIVDKGVSSVGEAIGMGEQGEEVAKEIASLAVDGTGYVSLIYRAIAAAMDRVASTEGYDFSIDKCLPKPRKPNYSHYTILLTLYAVLYVICILEPYLLRLRRKIMAAFYPKREKVRILFLHTKILSKRGVGANGGLLMSAVKRAFMDVQQSKEADKIDFFSKYAHRKGIVGFVARLITGRTHYRCDVCRLAGSKKHSYLFVRCRTFGCKGVYCVECYEGLHRMCMVCLLKETKSVREKRKKQREDLARDQPDDKRVSEVAEIIVESSGISDSSATSEDEDDDSLDDARKERKSVRFKESTHSKVDVKYSPLDVGKTSDNDESYSDESENDAFNNDASDNDNDNENESDDRNSRV